MQQLFTTPKVIFHRLNETFKETKYINEDSIYEWCFDAEVNYISNVNDMVLYFNVEVKYDKTTRRAILPCNIFRLVNVYDCSNNPLEYNLQPPAYIKLNSCDITSPVFISYYGLSVDDEGVPYIPSNHIPALETWCKIKLLEFDSLIGKFPYNVWSDIEAKFSRQVTAIKQSWARKDHEHSNKMDKIDFNMLPLAAKRRLLHKYYE